VLPLLLTFYLMHRHALALYPDEFQRFDKPDAKVPFSLGFLSENLGHAMNFFLSTGGEQPSSLVFFLIGVAGIALLGVALARPGRLSRWGGEELTPVFFIFSGGLLILNFSSSVFSGGGSTTRSTPGWPCPRTSCFFCRGC
jgi:hypothetical protein